MNGPWDKYAAPSESPEHGPWEKYGPPPEPSGASVIDQHVANSPGIKEATTPFEALTAGFQMSATGLLHGRPDMDVPKNASFFMKLSNTIGQGLGDLPFNIVGGITGATAGAAAGSESGPGAIVTGAAGGGAGAFALPEAVRQTMMLYYKSDQRHTWADFLHDVSHAAWETGKQAVIGGVAGPVAGKTGSVVEDLGGTAFTKTAANVAAFSASATGVQSVLDQHVPDGQDFALTAITALGFGAAGHYVGGKFTPSEAGKIVSDNSQEIYARSGIPPWEQAHAAKGDPVLNDELVTQDVNGMPNPVKFNSQRPPEPEPYKTNAFKVQDEHEQQMQEIHSEAYTAAHVEHMLPLIRTLEGSGDDAVSPAGAVGRFQIMPGTARQYGFDPSKLTDPSYNERAARTILADLSRRFHGDTEAVLIAYNAGPGRALTFLRDGRDRSELPKETQNYLAHAEREGENFGTGGGKPPEPPNTEPPKGEDGEPNFDKLTTESRVSRFLDAVGEQPAKPSASWSGFVRQWVSELESARGVDREMVRRGLLDPSKDLTTEDMFRQTYASDDRANHFFFRGAVDPITFADKGGPSLVDILKQVHDAGGTIDEFNAYRVAARTIEKAKQGIDTGVFKGGLAEAQANFYDPNLQKYKALDAQMQEWKHGGLEYARDSGSISQAQMDRMQAANTSHVSLRRIMGDNEAFGGTGRGFKTGNPLKAMEGSNRQIVQPLTADMDNLRQIVRLADRNRAIGHVIGSEEARMILGLKQITGPEAKATLAEPSSDEFKPYSMDNKEAEAFQPFVVQARKGAMSGNRFVFYRDGKPELWEASDPDFAKLMRGADSPGEANIVSKILQFPAKMQRAGIVGDIDFAFSVPLRHQLTAFVLDPLHPPPYLTAIRGALQSWNMGDKFWELVRHGGLNASMIELDKQVDFAHLMDETGAADKLWNTVRHPIQFAQMITERMTAAARIGYFERAQEMGVSTTKAAMMGRKAYLDFKEQPTANLAQMLAKWCPFFRASVLGLKQGAEAAVNNPGKTAIYTGLGLIVPQLGLYALNRLADQNLPDKDKYVNLPQWERDHYFITPPINGVRLKLGKPWVIGPMIGVPLERFLEKQWEDDPHAFDSILSAIGSDLTPSTIPAAVRPGLEAVSNHNFYTGQPLISDHLKQASGDMQYTDNTSEVSKKIAAAIGSHRGLGITDLSPILMDNLVRGWGGTIGMTVLHALDTPLGHVGPPSELADNIFVHGLVARNPAMDTKPINDFYTEAQQFTALHEDKVLEIKQGMTEQAMADAAGEKTALVLHVEHALNVQRTALEAIYRNPKMTVDEKRQFSERIYNDALLVAKFGLKAMRKGDVSGAPELEGRVEQDLQPAQP